MMKKGRSTMWKLAKWTVFILLICVTCITFFAFKSKLAYRTVRCNAIRAAHKMLWWQPLPEAGNGVLPDIVDEGGIGGGLSSWRLTNLQYVWGLEKAVHSDEPWNSAYNQHFAVLREAFCRSGEDETYIVAITGLGTAFPPNGRVELADVSDNTIVLVEVVDSGVNWMAPGDLVVSQRSGDRSQLSLKPGSSVDDVFVVAFADGQVWRLRNDTPQELLERFFLLDSAKDADRSVELAPYAEYISLIK